jgi:glycosyltransferase involved in cell wall biosynthesis
MGSAVACERPDSEFSQMSDIIAPSRSPLFGRVGFVTTRVAGTDGVSLEIKKWAEILESAGIRCYFITGESDQPAERTSLIAEAHFAHPSIRSISERAFGTTRRTEELTRDILELSMYLKGCIRQAIQEHQLEVLIAENALTIPMNIPLGTAIVGTVMETDIPCLAHHHDFYWERERFLVNCVEDFLHAAFPPPLPQIEHVVINSQAGREFCRRTGLPCRVIPNVMDFARPPAPADDYCQSFRETLGLKKGDLLILQPTRVVERKGIEHAVELVRRLGDPRAKLVITHSQNDEGGAYPARVREFARLMDVKVIFAGTYISALRGRTADGKPQFTIWDAFQAADLVTYPSTYEGFGNAFLEAIYYKKPILCNRYAIYRTDIEPTGLRPILMQGFLSDDVVEQVRRALNDEAYRTQMVEHNYATAARFFSYEVVRHELRSIVNRPGLRMRRPPFDQAGHAPPRG